jgi:hypothetical protein
MRKYFLFTAILFLCAAGPALAQNRTFGAWNATRSVDVIDDTNRSYIFNTESNNRDLGLALKCEYDGLNVMITHKYFVGDSDKETLVTYRFDSATPVGPFYWELGSKNTASFMPMPDVSRFISAARSAITIHVRIVDPFDGEILTASIPMRGFANALATLNNCR